jgi:hypothetical protein
LVTKEIGPHEQSRVHQAPCRRLDMRYEEAPALPVARLISALGNFTIRQRTIPYSHLRVRQSKKPRTKVDFFSTEVCGTYDRSSHFVTQACRNVASAGGARSWLAVRCAAPRLQFTFVRAKPFLQNLSRRAPRALASCPGGIARPVFAHRARHPSKGVLARGALRFCVGCCAPLCEQESGAQSKAYFGDGSGLSGVVGVIGFDGSGPLLSEELGPPGVVAGTLP